MAFGAEPAGADARAHTIYVWPSDELIAQSWHWPASWHEAFAHAMGRVGLGVAICVLDGRPFTRRRITMQLSLGSIAFSVRRSGTSIVVTISAFTGPEPPRPDGPEPDGGRRQPVPADGLVLGMRGSGRSFYLAVFHGYMPAIPAETLLPLGMSGVIRATVINDFIIFIDLEADIVRNDFPLTGLSSTRRPGIPASGQKRTDRAATTAPKPDALLSDPSWSSYFASVRPICWQQPSDTLDIQRASIGRIRPGDVASKPPARSPDRRRLFDWHSQMEMRKTLFDHLQTRYLH